jgi:hypothetical protein
MAGFGCHPAVQRLAKLADHHHVVDSARPERAKNRLPRVRQRLG